jgi:hypothetical protein
MNEPTDHIPPPLPRSASDPPNTAVGLSGVTAQAVTGERPASLEPSDPPLGRPPVDGTALGRIITNLNAIEQLAVFWGGDTGVKIRNHVGRIRELLGS